MSAFFEACFLFTQPSAISYNLADTVSAIDTGERSASVALTCPNCGNDKNFLVKSLQMHVVHLEDSRVEVSEESRPAVLEVLCDECDSALKLDELDDTIRKEVLLTIGAR
jgi:hypothetical protein